MQHFNIIIELKQGIFFLLQL